ncbi:ficolin-1-like [Palaemon carinicauda]|uniref:ficolin-1-like n=1 Tax=Palaemon carinicauda TaxID=392227 RepID=UPI0035B5F95E
MEQSWLTKSFLLCFMLSVCSGRYSYHCDGPEKVEMWIPCNTRTSIEEKLFMATTQILNGVRRLIQGKPTERLVYCPDDVNGQIDIYPSCANKKTVHCEGVNKTTSKLRIFYRNEQDGQESFERSWDDYKNGFEGTNHFWIGMESLAALHKYGEYRLMVEAKSKERTQSGEWHSFWVEGEEAGYKLHVGNFKSNGSDMSDVFSKYNNQIFSTHDKDNDEWESGNCAELLKGGWWYSTCPNDERARGGPENHDWIPTLGHFDWIEFSMFIQPTKAIPTRNCYGPNGDQEPVDLF